MSKIRHILIIIFALFISMQSVLANHTTGHGSDPGLFQLGLAIGGLAVIAGGIYYKINA